MVGNASPVYAIDEGDQVEDKLGDAQVLLTRQLPEDLCDVYFVLVALP